MSNPPRPVSGHLALRRRALALAESWRQTLSRSWEPAQASALYESVEQLVEQAEEEGARDIAAAALELAVYVCSIVDVGASPNRAQSEGLAGLVARLAATAGGETNALRNARASGDSSHRHAFYLREDAREMPGLASSLGRQGYIVHPFDERDALLQTLDHASPDVLLIDDAFVGEVHTITENVQRRRPAHQDPALCIVVAQETDTTRTLFAQRAGADALVAGHDPVALIARLDELRAQQRALGYRVLIVEDDPAQAKFCESILRHRGMHTRVCADPAGVRAMLDQFKPDMVLLDLYLPGSNGIEVAQQIRESGHAYLPIVFLSGEHDLELRFDAIRMGADDFLTKPVKPRHLVTAVESRIKRARQLAATQTGGRSERRGMLSGRDVLAGEVMRAARDEQDRCPALALIAVDNADEVMGKVGFVGSGALSQQLAAAIAAEIHGARTLSAWGELKFVVLLHADDELALRTQLEALRGQLESRDWMSEAVPTRVHISLGCVRLSAQLPSVDHALERTRTLCAVAQQAGGARCEFDLRAPAADAGEDPLARMVRAILRSPGVHGVAQFAFQPLVPLTGQLIGQYDVRMALKPPKSSQALLLQRADYLPIASDCGLTAHADRYLLREAMDLVRERRRADQELRLYLPITVSSLLDVAFTPWLAAELGTQGISGSLFALEFDALEIMDELPRVRGPLDSLQRLGVRLSLGMREAARDSAGKLFAVDAFSVVRFVRGGDADVKPEEAWDAMWSKAIAEARWLGKVTVACGITGMADMTVLHKIGAHYAQGDLLSAWLPDWSFDFAEVTG